MKKTGLALILIIFAVFTVYGQNEPIDLILLLDTSTGMSSSYDNVNDYITGGFLKEFLRVGDTFHLISFSGSPRLDVARRISSSGDVETIIGRMMLQYPVERGSNIQAAITYAEQYTSALPSRPKKIVLVTTGNNETANIVSSANQRLSSRNTTIDFVRVTPGQTITNVPRSGRAPAQQGRSTGQTATGQATGTTSRTSTASSTTSTRDTASTTRTTTATTTDTVASTGTTDTTRQTTTTGTASTTGTSTVTTNDTVGTTGTTAATTGTAATGDTSTTDTTSTARTTATGTSTTSAVSTTDVTDTTGTSSSTTGTTTTTESRQIADSSPDAASSGETERTSGRGVSRSSTTITTEKSSFDITSYLPWIIGLILLLLLIIGLIMFAKSRSLGSSPNRVMAKVASSPDSTASDERKIERVDHSKDLARYASTQNRRTTPYADRQPPSTAPAPVINPHGPLLLNLFVEDQNTHIGKRNIHSLKSGYGLSVGGGKGDGFLIFLVPLPANIGELRRNGSQLSFIPKKAKYFPDLGSNELRDCLNKTIRIISDKNYELRLRFEMYEDPLIALNRMLNSIKVPG